MMKKILSFILIAVTLFTVCLPLTSCGNDEIQYGKKYIYEYKDEDSDTERREVLIFNKDGTGTFECFYHYDALSDKYEHTISGTVSFIWEETKDGGIFIFKTDVRYNDEHTDGYTINVVSLPLYFSKNTVYYTTESGARRFILEGSDLYNEIYNKD